MDSRPALLYYYAEKIEKEWEDIKERVEGMVALVEVHVPTHEIGYA